MLLLALKVCLVLRVKCQHFCRILTKFGFYQQTMQVSTIKFHKNQFNGSRGATCGQTYVTKLIGHFCNFC